MTVRNAALLGLLAPRALAASWLPLLLMLAAGAALLLIRRGVPIAPGDAPTLSLKSPFSISSAFRFGAIFLGLQVAGTLAQRGLGQAGFLAVSFVGGLVSSASAVASAAMLAASGRTSNGIAGVGAVLAALASTLVNIPLVARVSKDRALTKRLAWPLGAIAVLGLAGATVQLFVPGLLRAFD
jgi:uncharacterized membrane protein (DUF4010 family)